MTRNIGQRLVTVNWLDVARVVIIKIHICLACDTSAFKMYFSLHIELEYENIFALLIICQ